MDSTEDGMGIRLFRDGPRFNQAPASPGRGTLEWLDEASKEGAAEARAALQGMFDLYPEHLQLPLANRLRAGNDDHDSALAELYFHEILRRCGFEVQVEPTCPGGTRPDFLVKMGTYSAYVEVTVDLGENSERRRRTAMGDLISQTSQRIQTTGFGIVVREMTAGKGNPSPSRFARFLDQWFSTFDHSEERQRWARGLDFAPKTVYAENDSGWSIDISLWTLESPSKKLSSIAGATGDQAKFVNSRGRLRQNVREKCKQHRLAERPLLLAVALNDFLTEPDQEDVVDVLLGSSYWAVDPASEGDGMHGRRRDGLWSPTNQRASKKLCGLVLARGVYPWTLNSIHPELWDNPLVSADTWLPPWPYRRLRWDTETTGELIEVPFKQGQ